MAARIVARVEEIRDVDFARRELLAKLSDDLRIPIRVLQVAVGHCACAQRTR